MSINMEKVSHVWAKPNYRNPPSWYLVGTLNGKEVSVKSLGKVTEVEARNEEEVWNKNANESLKIDGLYPSIRIGDFREVLSDIEDESVSLILTDPPYSTDSLPLYDDLGKFAARVLKPKGSLICYTGQTLLILADASLRKHLKYWWTLALIHKHGGQHFPGKWIRIDWKPVLWFVKGGRQSKDFVSDVLNGSRPEKNHHEWAQGIDEVIPIIEGLTYPGELVVDPFAGSGSFGKAALLKERRFLGAEIDKRRVHV